jgi:hypothetical protein
VLWAAEIGALYNNHLDWPSILGDTQYLSVSLVLSRVEVSRRVSLG